MSNTLLIWGVTAAYCIQAAILFYNSHSPQAIILLGYSFANLGLIWSLK